LLFEAIGDDPSDPVLFSNRSAAYAKLGQFKDALLDANKCIELDATWPKGYSRRGAAYMGLKSWGAALGAFEEGLKLEPNNKYMLEEAARMRNILEGGNVPCASSAGPPTSTASVSSKSGLVNQLHGLLSVAALFFAFFYVIPLFPRYAIHSYKASVTASMAVIAISLYGTWPLKWDTLKNPHFNKSQEMQALFLCLMMVVSPPLPFAIMPFAAISLHNVCQQYAALVRSLPNFIATRVQFLQTEEGGQMVKAFCAVSEVVVCFMGPVAIAANGLRVAVLVFFYFQYVSRRFQSHYWTKQAVTLLTQKFDGWFHHRYCPVSIRMVFDRFKGVVAFVASKVV